MMCATYSQNVQKKKFMHGCICVCVQHRHKFVYTEMTQMKQMSKIILTTF